MKYITFTIARELARNVLAFSPNEIGNSYRAMVEDSSSIHLAANSSHFARLKK
jgi:hypothetical protein